MRENYGEERRPYQLRQPRQTHCEDCKSKLEESWTGDFLYCVNLSCPKSTDQGIVWKRRWIPTDKRRPEQEDEE